MANMADIKNSLTLRLLPAAQPPITHQPFPQGLARTRVRAARREGGGGNEVRFFLRLSPTHDDTKGTPRQPQTKRLFLHRYCKSLVNQALTHL